MLDVNESSLLILQWIVAASAADDAIAASAADDCC